MRVLATIGGKKFWQLREISGGGGYGGQNLLAHFGLGDAAAVETLRIEWPSGIVQELPNISPNQSLTIVEPPALTTPKPGQLRIQSWRGQTFDLQASSTFGEWHLLAAVTNNTGTLDFTDSNTLSSKAKFYRAMVK